MDFMSAGFHRLDTDKSGELDVKEIARSRLRATPSEYRQIASDAYRNGRWLGNPQPYY
jgi:hypothetical protein